VGSRIEFFFAKVAIPRVDDPVVENHISFVRKSVKNPGKNDGNTCAVQRGHQSINETCLQTLQM